MGRKNVKGKKREIEAVEVIAKDEVPIFTATESNPIAKDFVERQKPKNILYVCGSDPQTARYEHSDKPAPICEACGRPMTAQR